MKESNKQSANYADRRQRLHELLIALIQKQEDFELLDAEAPSFDINSSISKKNQDPATWLERNKRIMRKYQSLVRSAITLDVLLDSEKSNSV